MYEIKLLADKSFVKVNTISITEPYKMEAILDKDRGFLLRKLEKEGKPKRKTKGAKTQPKATKGTTVTFVDLKVSFRGSENDVSEFIKNLKRIVSIPKTLVLKKQGGIINGEVNLQAIVFED